MTYKKSILFLFIFLLSSGVSFAVTSAIIGAGGGTITINNYNSTWWNRTGAILTPHYVGDSILLTTGNITTELGYVIGNFLKPYSPSSGLELKNNAGTNLLVLGVGSSSSTNSIFTGSVNFNNNLLYVDSTNNKIGIGTNSPYEQLDVIGNVNASYYYGDGSRLTNITSSGGGNASFNQTLTDTLYTYKKNIYGVSLTNPSWNYTFIRINQSGYTTIFTCPSNKRCLPRSSILNNYGTATVSWVAYINISGQLYLINPGGSVTAASSSSTTNAIGSGYILESGESFVFNITTGSATLNTNIGFLVYDNTSDSPFTPKLTTVSVGNNVLYNVSNNNKYVSFGLSDMLVNSQTSLRYTQNNNNGSATGYWYLVPSGYNINESTMVINNINVAQTGFGGYNLPFILANGDALVVNTSKPTSNQLIFASMIQQ